MATLRKFNFTNIVSPNHTSVPFIINDENNVKDVSISGTYFNSVSAMCGNRASTAYRHFALRFLNEIKERWFDDILRKKLWKNNPT